MAVGFKGLLGGYDDGEEVGGLLSGWQRKRAKKSAMPTLPVGAAPEPGQQAAGGSYWEGGDKMSAKDTIAAVLASAGDAFSEAGGGKGTNMSSLMGGRAARLEAARSQQVFSDLLAQGYKPEEARLMLLDPKAIGTNMASRSGSYTLGKGDVRYNGSRIAAERPDSFETPTGDRYSQRADGTTTQTYRETSPVYQNVDGMGVFGMDRHRAGVWQAPGGPSALTGGGSQYGDDWEVVDGPPPTAASAQAPSAMLTADQWREAQRALGPAAADAWRRRYNIQIGGR